jgi:PIN domain nuclease of toxin-antitoxin system
MRILLDTHIFLWFISGDPQLSISTRDLIRDSDNEVYLSVVSVWESIIKYQLGKLPLPESRQVYADWKNGYIGFQGLLDRV